MRKLNLLLSVICLMLVVRSVKIVSPDESTTINFFISNPSGSYEFCVDSVFIQFTDHVGDITVITPMPVYPKICICPKNVNSSCLNYSSAGNAYGQSQGYRYAQSSTYELAFNITLDPNPDSSLSYPGVSHSYNVVYSYKFVNCKIGCWFENPQQESYSDMMYVRGLTRDQVTLVPTQVEQVAANSIIDAQEDVSDAFNAIEQARSTISLSSTAQCISTSKANSYLSLALSNYSRASSELTAAQSAYSSKDYDAARYNATLARQFATQTKNDADMATTLIQAELQRAETIADKLAQANLSVSYSKVLETKAEGVGVHSYEATALISLASEYLNKTDSACKAGEYAIVTASADTAIEKANTAKNLLEPLVKSKLIVLYGGYIGNLSKMGDKIGVFSSNYSNSTIEELTRYKNNLENGTSKEFFIYLDSLPATTEIVEGTISAFADINKTVDRMQSLVSRGNAYHQQMNLSEVELLLQTSVVEISNYNFNSSLNLTNEANLRLTSMEGNLNTTIGKIENAKVYIETSVNTINNVSSDRLIILGPDMSEAEVALRRARENLYSQPDRARDYAIQARVLAVEQRKRLESTKLGIAGVVILIIILAVILSRIKYPFKTARKPYKVK